MNNLKSYTEYAVTSSTTDFVIGFDFNYGMDAVNVTVDGVPADEAGYTVVYLNSTTMRLTPAVTSGTVRLQRETDIDDPDNQFTAGAKFIASNMDENFTQVRKSQQEVRDGFSKLATDTYALIDGLDDALELAQDASQEAQAAADTVNAFIVNGKVISAKVLDASGQTQQQINDRTVTPYNFGAIGDGLAHPLSERYATLAAAQAVYPSATSLGEYIDGHALNAWWRDICANDRKYATCHGQFMCNTKISNANINSYLNPIKTKRVDFNANIRVTASQVTDNFWEMVSTRQCDFSGFLDVRDLGGLDYNSRKFNVLIYLEDFIHGEFAWKVVAKYARYLGMRAVSGSANSINNTTANNNSSNLGSWQFDGCGHRFKHKTFNFTARVETGSSQGVDQRNVLTVSDLGFSTDELADSILKYKNKPYLITSNTGNTIECYPWFDDADTSGDFEISWGGDFRLIGADSNHIKMSSGSADCAICAGREGFYTGFKDQRVNEFCDVGLRLGISINSTQRRLTLAGLYFEGHVFDIVKTSITSTDNTIILNPNSVDLSKCHSLAPLSTAKNPAYNLLASWTIVNGDRALNQKKYQYSSGINPTTTISVSNGDDYFKLRANSAVITLTADTDMLRLFGLVDVEFEIFGTAANNGPSGVTTLKCQSGYTINNSASDLIIPASNSAFKVSARLVNEKDWRVYVFYAERPKASKAHDWASLAAGAQRSTTLQVPGANVGDSAVASMDVPLSGTSLRAEVTATNTVTVYHYNPTTAAVDVASGTLMVKLI